MARPVFIGNELTASGYRLAGADVRTTSAEEALGVVRAAMIEGPPLILVALEFVQLWGYEERVEILGAVKPPVLPVGDAADGAPPIDLVGWIRSCIIA